MLVLVKCFYGDLCELRMLSDYYIILIFGCSNQNLGEVREGSGIRGLKQG